MTCSKHAKTASDFVNDYKLNLEDFPDLLVILDSISANYFISKAYKKANDPEYIPLWKVEDLFYGHKTMLVDLIKSMMKKGF
jgi:hypothetical protein